MGEGPGLGEGPGWRGGGVLICCLATSICRSFGFEQFTAVFTRSNIKSQLKQIRHIMPFVTSQRVGLSGRLFEQTLFTVFGQAKKMREGFPPLSSTD